MASFKKAVHHLLGSVQEAPVTFIVLGLTTFGLNLYNIAERLERNETLRQLHLLDKLEVFLDKIAIENGPKEGQTYFEMEGTKELAWSFLTQEPMTGIEGYLSAVLLSKENLPSYRTVYNLKPTDRIAPLTRRLYTYAQENNLDSIKENLGGLDVKQIAQLACVVFQDDYKHLNGFPTLAKIAYEGLDVKALKENGISANDIGHLKLLHPQPEVPVEIEM